MNKEDERRENVHVSSLLYYRIRYFYFVAVVLATTVTGLHFSSFIYVNHFYGYGGWSFCMRTSGGQAI